MLPLLRDGVALGTYTDEDTSEVSYFAQNDRGEEFDISEELYHALSQADGRHELQLPGDDPEGLLAALEDNELITTSRLVRKGVFHQLTLILLGEPANRLRPLCRVVNGLLPVLSLLVLAAGIVLRIRAPFEIDDYYSVPLYYAAIFLSVSLHEFGHFAAALSYKFRPKDAGLLLLLGFFPIGAYVSCHGKSRKNYRQSLQLYLAGVEMNFLLAGVCLMVSTMVYPMSLMLLSLALVNVVLGVSNLLPISGLDGEGALSALLHMDSVGQAAKRCLSSRKERRKLLRSGLPGIAAFALFGATYVAKAIMILLIIAGPIYALLN